MKKRKLVFLSAVWITICFSSAGCQNKSFDQELQNLLQFSIPTLHPHQLDSIILSGTEIILIDNRTEKEYLVSHISGAHWVPYGLEMNWSKLTEPDQEKLVIFYCSVGYRSEKTAEIAVSTGLKKVYNLYGGIFLWNNLGYPLLDNENKITSRIHGYNKEWSKWIKKGELTLE